MKYITGIHALNLNCSLETTGDWHQSAIQWDNPKTKESEKSIWGEYGIETNSHVPHNEGVFYVANHVRALLDLLEEGNFSVAQGMCNNYIDNPKYTKDIFDKVSLLKNHPLWDKIDSFMGKEYKMEWLNFRKGTNHG